MIPLHRAMHDAIVETIRKPEFDAALPPLSDATWAKLLAGSADEERERLEFLGDALMYATIGTMLFHQIPQGSPHLYTNLRSVLHSNAIFSRVAERLDILAVPDIVLRALSKMDFGEGTSAPTSKSYTEVKATADLFETVLGAYYLERGFGALCEWVGVIYAPLVFVAQRAFYDCQILPNGKRARPYTSSDYSMRKEAEEGRKKRRLMKPPIQRSAVPLGSRTNVNRSEHSGRPPQPGYQYLASTSVKTSRGPGPHSVTVKTKISAPGRRRMSPGRIRSPVSVRKTVAQSKPKPVFIDLTLLSDSSDDESDPSDGPSPTVADGDGDESQEEAMLEDMLTAHVDSDMDLQSESDWEEGELTMDLGTDSDRDGSDMDLGSESYPMRT